VIVGGFAATLHGSSLVTRDLDVCAILSDQNVEKLRDALRDLQPTHRAQDLDVDHSLQALRSAQHHH
jgi:adenine deaminase